jgi:hypothetical protein
MNVFRICLFIFLFQMSVYLLVVVGIPEFSAGSMGTSSMEAQIAIAQNDTYARSPVNTNTYDLTQTLGSGLNMFTLIIYSMAAGMHAIIVFAFGTSPVIEIIGWGLQSLVWYFYFMVIMKILGKDVSGDI